MRDRLDHLFQHCADLGVDVEWEDLGEYRRGEYRHDERVIALSLFLTTAQAVSTLAHEIGHAFFGDTCSTPTAERRAWEYGAAMLLRVSEVERAATAAHETSWGRKAHRAAVACELGVTPRLVDAWYRWWERQGHSPLSAEQLDP